jgi:hypothetical protein
MAIIILLFLCIANAFAETHIHGFSLVYPDREFVNESYKYTIINTAMYEGRSLEFSHPPIRYDDVYTMTIYQGINVRIYSLPLLMDRCTANITKNTTDKCNIKFSLINIRYNLAAADYTRNNTMIGHYYGRYHSYIKPSFLLIDERVVVVNYCFHMMSRVNHKIYDNNTISYTWFRDDYRLILSDCKCNPLCVGVMTYAGNINVKYSYYMIYGPPYKCNDTTVMLWTSKAKLKEWGLFG